MYTAQLYQLYCQSYGNFYREHGGVLLGRSRQLSGIEAVVIEFAAEDASNGTPLRSPGQFAACIAAGSDALTPLGLTPGVAQAARSSPAGVLLQQRDRGVAVDGR